MTIDEALDDYRANSVSIHVAAKAGHGLARLIVFAVRDYLAYPNTVTADELILRISEYREDLAAQEVSSK